MHQSSGCAHNLNDTIACWLECRPTGQSEPTLSTFKLRVWRPLDAWAQLLLHKSFGSFIFCSKSAIIKPCQHCLQCRKIQDYLLKTVIQQKRGEIYTLQGIFTVNCLTKKYKQKILQTNLSDTCQSAHRVRSTKKPSLHGRSLALLGLNTVFDVFFIGLSICSGKFIMFKMCFFLLLNGTKTSPK